MSEQLTEIIHPEKFIDVPISKLINTISQPNYTPTDEEIASLIVKYLWRYHKPQSRDGSLNDTTALMQIMEYYFAHRRFPGATFNLETLPVVARSIFDFLKKHEYAIGMLGDVSSTTAIVRSIILQKIDDKKRTDFYGLDIGAGSGILALAQYILARRNGLRSIRIDGLEQSLHVARQAETTLRSIIPGGTFYVHTADSTKEHGYRKVLKTPDFISIELLPYSGGNMIIHSQEKSGRNTHADPFFPSLFALRGKFSNLMDVCAFPQSIRVYASLSEERESGFVDMPLGGEKGLFDLASLGADKMASFISEMRIHSIRLYSNQDPQILSDIGSHMLQTPENPEGWVKLFPLWLYRWKNMIRHNPTYHNLFNIYDGATAEQRARFPVLPPLKFRDTVAH